jgi:ketosteroid isomerase-like protein
MQRWTLRAISVGALLFVSGLVAAADTTSPDATAIREARLAQNQALVDQDLDRVATFWTDDVTIRRGLGQHAMGKAEYRKIFEPPADPAARMIYQREPGTIEVSPNWPLAYEEGRWTGRLGGTSAPTVITGRYAAQWVKRDGRWLIRSEVYVALTCADSGCRYQAAP